MKAACCPNCLESTGFNFFERRMTANKAKSCNKCGVLLKPTKIEWWVLVIFIGLITAFMPYVFQRAGLAVTVSAFLVSATVYHLTIQRLPLEIEISV